MKKVLFGGLAASVILSACGTPVAMSDGTYTQHQTYSPAENASFYIDVTAVIANDLITDIAVTGQPGAKLAETYATEFNANLSKDIVGKSITKAKSMGRVSGASATSQAFQDALTAIADQATAQ